MARLLHDRVVHQIGRPHQDDRSLAVDDHILHVLLGHSVVFLASLEPHHRQIIARVVGVGSV